MRVISEAVVKHRTVHDRTGGNFAIEAKAELGALIWQFRASRTPSIPAEFLAHQDSIGVPVVHGETLRNHTNKSRRKLPYPTHYGRRSGWPCLVRTRGAQNVFGKHKCL